MESRELKHMSIQKQVNSQAVCDSVKTMVFTFEKVRAQNSGGGWGVELHSVIL